MVSANHQFSRWVLLAAVLAALLLPHRARAADVDLKEAKKLLLTGKYSEAADAYAEKVEQDPQAVIGLARARAEVGKLEEADLALKQGAEKHDKAAAIPAEQARLEFDRGDYPAAQKHVDAALKLDKDHCLARWLNGELHRVAGRLPEASAVYQSLVTYYNRAPVERIRDPENLFWIAQGATQAARWNRSSGQFNTVVNTLYPNALKAEANFWPARLQSGLLFAEKYNEVEAEKDLKAALTINPNAAEALAAKAELDLQNYDLADAKTAIDRALEINPKLIRAYQLRGLWHLSNFEPTKAIEALEAAKALNPVDETTLGTLAGAYGAIDGIVEEAAGRAAKLVEEANTRNAHAGEFHLALASALDALRKFPAAAHYYEEATKRMPQLTEPRGQLGMMLMRLGKEEDASKLLRESFKVDPFNVRVSNMLKVLDVLAGYAVIETEHFIVRFDRGPDEALAKAAVQFLEEDVYPDLTKKLAYTPKDKTLIEFFNRAKNTGGHGWFSARMVGLPYVGTVGACAGKMIAMASPSDMAAPFNWSRVLKHEYVHVINLQQTNFNIPHWFTEALAVYHEGYPHPPDWNALLAERVSRKETFDLETINLGFIRPHSSHDWTLAYFQALLYAQYMVERFGADSHAKMLSGYADNLTTSAAIERSFGIKQDEFEKGYREYLAKVIRETGAAPAKAVVERTREELEKLVKETPDDADASAELALICLRASELPKARERANAALKLKPKHQVATFVLARLKLSIGEEDEAKAMVEAALDRENPEEHLIALAGAIKGKAGEFEAAAELYELAAKHFPNDPDWPQMIVKAYMQAKADEKLPPWLEKIAIDDADDFPVRVKLAELALKKKDFATATKWATQATRIDVNEGEPHKLLGQAQMGAGQPDRAAAAFEFAARFLPKDQEVALGWAESLIATKQYAKAKPILEKLLEADPKLEAALRLQERLVEAMPPEK